MSASSDRVPAPRQGEQERKLSALSPDARALVTLAAVAKGPIPRELLTKATDKEDAALEELLDECRGLGFTTDDATTFQIATPGLAAVIVQHAETNGMASAVLTLLRRAFAGDASLALHAPAGRRARKGAAVAAGAVAAGERALIDNEAATAMRYFDRALELEGRRDPNLAGRAHRGIADAIDPSLSWIEDDARTARRVSSVRAAFEHFLTAGNRGAAIEAAIGSRGQLKPAFDAVLHQVNRDALALARPQSPEYARLLAALASSYYFSTADFAGAERRHAEARRVVRSLADPGLMLAVEQAFFHAAKIACLSQEVSSPRWDRALSQAEEAGDTKLSASLVKLAADRHVRMGHPEVASGVLLKLGMPAPRVSTLLARLRGERDSLASMLAQHASQFPEVGVAELEACYRGPRAPLETLRAIPIEGRSPEFLLCISMATAQVARMAGTPEAASAAADRIAWMASPAATYSGATLHYNQARGHCAVAAGDVVAAREVYPVVRELFGTEPAIYWGIDSCSFRLLGGLATLTGANDDAVELLERAVAFCANAGYRAEQVWCAYDLGRALEARRARGDANRARRQFGHAIEIADELGLHGMRAMLTRTANNAGRGESHHLSPRETEVLRLAVKGFTNAELGEYLRISPSTVKNHVAAIYRKLEVANRAEAATRAAQLGLV